MKLKQIKEFNTETVTQKIASEIMSIMVWNHFNEEKYIGRFEIKNATPYGKIKGGSKYPWEERDELDGYVKTASGVIIKSPFYSEVRIHEDGKASAYSLENPDSDFETVRRTKGNIKSEYKLDRIALTHNSQAKLMQLYIDNGFFTIENVFTIEEFRNYLSTCDSFGDALYYLNAENIIKANQPEEEELEEGDY